MDIEQDLPSPLTDMDFYVGTIPDSGEVLRIRNKWQEHISAWLMLAPYITTVLLPEGKLREWAAVHSVKLAPWDYMFNSREVRLYLTGFRAREHPEMPVVPQILALETRVDGLYIHNNLMAQYLRLVREKAGG